ncbi:MAG: tetratricopeptide repeat protein [Hyphomicrobium sp.]
MVEELERKLAAARRGHASAAAGDFEGAIKGFSEALLLDPGNTNLVFSRGLALFKTNSHALAIADFTVVIDAMPSWPSGYVHRGQAYLGLQDFDHAIADFTESIRLSPALGPLYRNRALAYEANGDHERAKLDFAEAKRLNG